MTCSLTSFKAKFVTLRSPVGRLHCLPLPSSPLLLPYLRRWRRRRDRRVRVPGALVPGEGHVAVLDRGAGGVDALLHPGRQVVPVVHLADAVGVLRVFHDRVERQRPERVVVRRRAVQLLLLLLLLLLVRPLFVLVEQLRGAPVGRRGVVGVVGAPVGASAALVTRVRADCAARGDGGKLMGKKKESVLRRTSGEGRCITSL